MATLLLRLTEDSCDIWSETVDAPGEAERPWHQVFIGAAAGEMFPKMAIRRREGAVRVQ